MTELMQTLYDYVRREEVPKYRQTAEWREVQQAISAQGDRLNQEYPDLFGSVDALLSEYNIEHEIEQEAMFEAAFALCAQLIRLIQGQHGG